MADEIFSTIAPQAKQTVGTTPARLPDVGAREVWITADSTNSGGIYLGDATVTTAGGGNVFTRLAAGVGVVLDISNPALFYAVGSAAGQVFYVGVFK